jgi:crossover junction endodeoxyribonuclease RuvC
MNILFTRFNPHIMAIERIFFSTNVKTAIRVGQAQGVMLLAAAHRRVPIAEYAPGTIKKQVTGSGRADKKQVIATVQEIFGSKVNSKAMGKTHFDNAADALAIALCHAFIEREK